MMFIRNYLYKLQFVWFVIKIVIYGISVSMPINISDYEFWMLICIACATAY